MAFIDLLSKIVASVESLNNIHALRFEEKLYTSYQKRKVKTDIVRLINKCSLRTAYMIMATSWGKYQILGYNLYNKLNYDKPIGYYLNEPDEQDFTFIEYIKKFFQTPDVENYARKIINELDQLKELKSFYGVINFKDVLVKHFDNIQFTIQFIRIYNGAIFPSASFQNYLLRMLHAYEKFKKEVNL